MSTSVRRNKALKVSAILALAVSGAVWAQVGPGTGPVVVPAATAPATAPTTGPTARLPGVDSTKTMAFKFEGVPVDTILNTMSQRFGFIIINTGSLPTQRITVQNPKEVDAAEAIRLFNEILVPLGYVTLVTTTAPDPLTNTPANTILRIVNRDEGKKANIPVVRGADPDGIPVSDDLRTQIIPLQTISAPGLVNELRNFISSDADIGSSAGSNSIVITDTSAKIHRLAEIVKQLDNAKKSNSVIQYRQLINSSATDAARLINAMFSPTNTGTGGGTAGGAMGGQQVGVPAGAAGRGGAAGGRGGGGGGASAQPITARLYADSDTRTNTVILSGPDDQVADALNMLNRIEAIPLDYNNTTVFFIKHLRNAQTNDITPVLNQIFGGTGTTGGGGTTANRGTGTTTNRNSTGSTNNRGGTAGRSGTSGTTGRLGASAAQPDNTLYNTGAGGGGGGGGGGGRGGGATGGGGGGGLGGGGGGGAAAGGGGLQNRGNTTNNNNTGARNNSSGAAAALAGQAYFVANPDTNSILVTTDRLYEEKVRSILDELDRPVPQVLIKVLIAEVTHANGDDIGFEFGSNNLLHSTDINGNAVNHGVQAGTDFGAASSTGGFKIGLVENQVSATLKALAHQNKLDVLSRPYILAQDNQEAYMQIGQSVPYITNSQISNTGQTINSVAYTNVGVILDVIPHINPDGLVTLDIAPQVSALDPSSGVPISSNVTAPVFTVRQAQSRVAIRNGETIVIGGLMQDQKTQVINKVPLLGDIPYLGMLFKDTKNDKIKTELLIFLTPHVAMDATFLKGMTDDEMNGLKLVPNSVQPGTWEQEMQGMERGATTTRPSAEIRIQGGNLTPAPEPTGSRP